MISILAIAPYRFLPAENGGQKAIEVLYKSIAKHANLSVVSTSNNDLSKDHGFELLPLLSNSKIRYIDPSLLYSISRFIRKRNITHILIEHPYMGWLAVMLKKITGCKLIIHSHNIEGERYKSFKKIWAPALAYYEKIMHQKADLSLFITQEDQEYAIRNFKLEESKTTVIPFAVELRTPPSFAEKVEANKKVAERYAIDENAKLLLFTGIFSYSPNLDALQFLIHKVVPLLDAGSFNYRMIVCGKDVPQSLLNSTNDKIIFTGFVDDIYEYYRAADIFLNPVISGGGIKTKLVEALANNCIAISGQSGAIGIPPSLANEKLIIVPDNDANAFAEAIFHAPENNTDIPSAFFRYFNADFIGIKLNNALVRLKKHS